MEDCNWPSRSSGTVGYPTSLLLGILGWTGHCGWSIWGQKVRVRPCPKQLAMQVHPELCLMKLLPFSGRELFYAGCGAWPSFICLEPGLHQARVSPSSAASAAKSLVPAVKPRCGPSAFDLVKKLKQARVAGWGTSYLYGDNCYVAFANLCHGFRLDRLGATCRIDCVAFAQVSNSEGRRAIWIVSGSISPRKWCRSELNGM